jgi:hypothetical protein
MPGTAGSCWQKATSPGGCLPACWGKSRLYRCRRDSHAQWQLPRSSIAPMGKPEVSLEVGRGWGGPGPQPAEPTGPTASPADPSSAATGPFQNSPYATALCYYER